MRSKVTCLIICMIFVLVACSTQNNDKEVDKSILSFIDGYKSYVEEDTLKLYSLSKNDKIDPSTTYWFQEISALVNNQIPRIQDLNWLKQYRNPHGYDFSGNKTLNLNDTLLATNFYSVVDESIPEKEKIIDSVLSIKDKNGRFNDEVYSDYIYATNIALSILTNLDYNLDELTSTKNQLIKDFENIRDEDKNLSSNDKDYLRTLILIQNLQYFKYFDENSEVDKSAYIRKLVDGFDLTLDLNLTNLNQLYNLVSIDNKLKLNLDFTEIKSMVNQSKPKDGIFYFNNAISAQGTYEYTYIDNKLMLNNQNASKDLLSVLNDYKLDYGWKKPVNNSPSYEATYYALDTIRITTDDKTTKPDVNNVDLIEINSLKEYYYYLENLRILNIDNKAPQNFTMEQISNEAYWFVEISKISNVENNDFIKDELKKIYKKEIFNEVISNDKIDLVSLYRICEVYDFLYGKWYESHSEKLINLLNNYLKKDGGYSIQKGTDEFDVIGCYYMTKFNEKLNLKGYNKEKVKDLVMSVRNTEGGFSYTNGLDPELQSTWMSLTLLNGAME